MYKMTLTCSVQTSKSHVVTLNTFSSTCTVVLKCSNSCVSLIPGSLVTTPQPQEVTEGGSAWFSCSTDSAYGGIDWKHSYVGAPRPHDVYVNGMLLNGYKEHGRYSVDASTPGSSILLIRNVQMHDAGMFICVDNNGAGESSSARLTVRGSNIPCVLIVYRFGEIKII